MSFFEVFLISVGLAMDAFAVSVSNGILLNDIRFHSAFRFGLFFGVFQFFMPFVGWLCAKNFKDAIESFDHWIAFILLVLIGGKMFHDSFKDKDDNIISDKNILSFYNMVMLSIATSIDALAVGVSFAFFSDGLSIFQASAVIGFTTFILSYFGVYLGKKIGGVIHKNAEKVGGLILIGIGIKILIEHLF